MTDIPENGMFLKEIYKVDLVYQRSSSKVSNFAITVYGVEQYRHLYQLCSFCKGSLIERKGVVDTKMKSNLSTSGAQ